ncbi:hypothetical protein MFM001_42280 [Mycobacterium sp. MFM001]|nr:hypothetical protein [Mycobacterium sp. MFM001]GBE67766.1 hypothetical protein MFM001_42280 [Mycobacterium sp. MFM001]
MDITITIPAADYADTTDYERLDLAARVRNVLEDDGLDIATVTVVPAE